MAKKKKSRASKAGLSKPNTKSVDYSKMPSKTEKEHLEILLKYTERAITNQGTSIDDFFVQQANKLRVQIADLSKV